MEYEGSLSIIYGHQTQTSPAGYGISFTCVAKKLKYPFSPVVLVSPLRISLLDFTLATSHSL